MVSSQFVECEHEQKHLTYHSIRGLDPTPTALKTHRDTHVTRFHACTLFDTASLRPGTMTAQQRLMDPSSAPDHKMGPSFSKVFRPFL